MDDISGSKDAFFTGQAVRQILDGNVAIVIGIDAESFDDGQFRLVADGGDDLIGRDDAEFSRRYHGGIFEDLLFFVFQAFYMVRPDDGFRCRIELELDAIGLGFFVFRRQALHVLFSPAVDDFDVRTEAQRRAGRIDGDVAGADDDDLVAFLDGQVCQFDFTDLDALDIAQELFRIDDAVDSVVVDAEIPSIHRTDGDEDGIEITLQFVQGFVDADFDVIFDGDAHSRQGLGFALQ